MTSRSKFANDRGILFAADLPETTAMFSCLDDVSPYIDAVKLGNSVLYSGGLGLVRKVKELYGLPVVVHLKLTDVGHIASTVVGHFVRSGADALIMNGLCGPEVLRDAVRAAEDELEIWAFTEFTNDSGMIDETLADRIVRAAVQAGVLGFQVPGTKPHRVEAVRDEVGEHFAVVCCGIGSQGGRCGNAINSGANLEIIGRSIYAHTSPRLAAELARNTIKQGRDRKINHFALKP